MSLLGERPIRYTPHSDARVWNSSWEKALSRAYSPHAPVVTAQKNRLHFCVESDAANQARGEGLVAGQWRRLSRDYGTPEAFERTYPEPWRKLGKEEREEIVIKAIVHSATSHYSEGLPVVADLNRIFCPELTLEGLAGRRGEGLLRLVEALRAEGTLETFSLPFVRHEGFERVFGFHLGSEGRLPESAGVRSFQSNVRLVRCSLLFYTVDSIMRLIARPFRDGRIILFLLKPSAVAGRSRARHLPAGRSNRMSISARRRSSCAGCFKTSEQTKKKKNCVRPLLRPPC